MASGPVVIGFNGSPGSDRALREAADLLAPRPAILVVVWKQGLAFELMEHPTATVGLPPSRLDLASTLAAEESLYESARRLAEQGAAIAREAGFDAEPLVAADDVDTPVAETLARLARKEDAAGIVVLRHPRRGEWIIGSTTRDVIRYADRSVVVARTEPDQRRSSPGRLG